MLQQGQSYIMAGAGAGCMVSGAGYAQQTSELASGCETCGSAVRGRGKHLAAVILGALLAVTCFAFVARFSPISSMAGEPVETAPLISEDDCWSASKIAEAADNWSMLSESERLEAAQAMVDRESIMLGLPSRQVVTSGDLEPDVMGQHEGSVITIDEDALAGDELGWEVVEVAGHETYHAYQHAIIDGSYGDAAGSKPCPEQSTIDQWRWEFDHYQTSGGGYFAQEVEISARQYAREAVERLKQDALKGVA